MNIKKNERRQFLKSRLPLMVLTISSAVFLLAALSVSIFQHSVVTGSERRLPIYSVASAEKKVAVSFDTAWGDEHMEAILDILDDHDVKSTFFLVGAWIDKYPEWVTEIGRRGHEVEIHSQTHPDMAAISEERMLQELRDPADKVEQLTGRRPILFRPPFGSYSNTLIDTAESEGFAVIQWSVDSLDWKNISAEQIIDRVVRNVEPGSIVLFHNNGEQVETYLPVILKRLEKNGYEIVPVGELIYRENYTTDRTGKQVLNKN